MPSRESNSDRAHETRMKVGAGLSDYVAALDADTISLIEAVMITAEAASRALRDQGLDHQGAAATVIGAALTGAWYE